jgi:hypothetical protein
VTVADSTELVESNTLAGWRSSSCSTCDRFATDFVSKLAAAADTAVGVEMEVEVAVDEGGAAEDKAASRRNTLARKLARSLLSVPLVVVLVVKEEDGEGSIGLTADRRAAAVASTPNTVDGMVVAAAVAAVAIVESTAAVVLISWNSFKDPTRGKLAAGIGIDQALLLAVAAGVAVGGGALPMRCVANRSSCTVTVSMWRSCWAKRAVNMAMVDSRAAVDGDCEHCADTTAWNEGGWSTIKSTTAPKNHNSNSSSNNNNNNNNNRKKKVFVNKMKW